MTNEELILAELQKINIQLAKQNQGHLKNFFGGFLYSFGYFAGTIAIFAIIAIYASRLNWPSIIGRSIETMTSQINWTKIIPAPKVEFTSPFSQP